MPNNPTPQDAREQLRTDLQVALNVAEFTMRDLINNTLASDEAANDRIGELLSTISILRRRLNELPPADFVQQPQDPQQAPLTQHHPTPTGMMPITPVITYSPVTFRTLDDLTPEQEAEVNEVPSPRHSCYHCGHRRVTTRCGDYDLCTQCREAYFNQCNHCNNMCYENDLRNGICYRCREDMFTLYLRKPLENRTFNLIRSQRSVGFELEYFCTESHQSCFDNYGIVKDDGSIDPYMSCDEDENYITEEFASYPAYGDDIAHILKTVTTRLQRDGAETNDSCGVHVHISIRDDSHAQRRRIALWWAVFEPLLYGMVDSTRSENSFCGPTRRLRYPWDNDRYRSLNICPMTSDRRTFEVRMHHGTLSYTSILGWIQFLTSFFDTFSHVPATTRSAIDELNPREKLNFLFMQTKMPLSLCKHIVYRLRRECGKSWWNNLPDAA